MSIFNTKNCFQKVFLLLTLIFLVFSQQKEKPTTLPPYQTLKLDETFSGNTTMDKTVIFFILTIPKDSDAFRLGEGKTLNFKTQENLETISKLAEDGFSDPDIFISKTNKYPSTKRTSTWYSESYGPDIVSIPPSSVKPGDVFYIGLYCETRCRFDLTAQLTDETEILLGEEYELYVKPRETMNYKLKIEKDFNNLRVISYTKTGQKFKIFMSKENTPTSENSFDSIPSWKNGYSIEVSNEDEEYCSNCTYHIIIQNEGNDHINNLMLYAYLSEEVFEVTKNQQYFDFVNNFERRCYKFPMTAQEKKDEKLIIQINLFSGDARLLIDGWKLSSLEDLGRRGPPRFDFERFQEITSSEEIILSKIDFDKFDKELNETITNREKFDLYFCLNSFHETSYSLTTYFLTQIEKIQELEGINFLSPGQQLRSYLLKDQVVRYELIGTDREKAKFGIKTNLTVATTSIVGKVSTYGYNCIDQKCVFKKNDIEGLLKEKKLITALKRENYDDEEIINIKYDENTCFKTPLLKIKNGNIITCSNLIYVKCDKPDKEGMCVYDLLFETENLPLLMKPNEIYAGTIPLNSEDLYEIRITSTSVHSIVAVMDTQSGDAELLFFKINESKDNEEETTTLLKGSFNENYLPEVIRITPAMIKKDNLVGRYQLKIVSNGFSSYHLYYYVTYNKDETDLLKKYNLPEITFRLNIGDYVADYFPNDINYKVFSFSTSLREKTNLKVFINKINVGFEFYIYGKITEIPVEKLKNYTSSTVLGNYLWKSDEQNSELIIQKTDFHYELDKTYYIVVIPKIISQPIYDERTINNKNGKMIGYDFEIPPDKPERVNYLPEKSAMKFYIGVAEKQSPLFVNEGTPHQFWLNSDYEGQLYFYHHFNNNQDLELRIDVSFGVVSAFISFNQIDVEKIDKFLAQGKKDEAMALVEEGSLNIPAIGVFSIPKEEFKKRAKKNSYLTLNIYIRRNEDYKNTNKNCLYNLVVRSSEDKGELLKPGEVRNSEFMENKVEHFIIEEVQKRNGGIINVNFRNGYGKVYVRIPDVPETKNIRFPGPQLYDYIGEQVYSGVIVKIPKFVYDTLDNKKIKLQILVTVEAILGYNDDISRDSIISDASFSISYSNEPKIINQNHEHDGFLHRGEMDYFTFYFEEDTENIFIGLSGMSGDADMYLNYGTSLPTPSKNNWESVESGVHEYIDFNLEDDFFKLNNITSLKGFYTLLVIGLTDTSFTIYISKHKNKIIPLRNNRPMPCYCENKGDKCYFRLNEVFEIDNREKGKKRNELIFTTQYLYGNGFMYAKLITDDSELYLKDFYKSFPDENDYDISNKESHQRNYVKMKLAPEKITSDSLVLMTFECEEKTQVDITVTNLRHYKSFDYMAENRENVYYLGYNPDNKEEQAEIDILFNNFYPDKDFIYTIHSYTGDAHVTVYSNTSHWDRTKLKVVYDYKLYKEFEIINSFNGTKDNQIDIYNPYSSDYSNYISKKAKENHRSFGFKITPKSEFGFYIQGNFDREWNNIIIGKPRTYFAKNGVLNGYFDIIDEYDDIEFNLNVQNNLFMEAEVFIKINVIDSNKKKVFKENEKVNEFQLFHYSLPSNTNYDYRMKTDPTLGTLNIYINHLPKLKKGEESYKFIRALFLVQIKKEVFTPLPTYDPIDDNPILISKGKSKKNPKNNEYVSILVTPGVSHYKYVDAKPYEYYFSNITYNPKADKKSVKSETKIFTLSKLDPSDDIMVIEISSCYGRFEYKLTQSYIPSEIELETQNGISNFDYHEENRRGKKVIYVKNLSQKHIYLSIKSIPVDPFCPEKLFSAICNRPKDLAYLMYYYSTSNKFLSITETFDKMVFPRPYGKGKIRIPLPKLISKDLNKNEKKIDDFKFDIFATTDESYYKKMENICYLSRFKFWKEGVYTEEEKDMFNLENIHLTKIDKKNNLIISGLKYRRRYYIAILAQNVKTKEMIAFIPFEAWTGGFLPFYLWQTLSANLVIVVLVVILIIICRKYKGAKAELKEIKGDALPKSSEDIGSSSRGGQSTGVRYSGLGESY